MNIKDLYEQEMLSLAQIAKRLKLPASRVKKQLERQGVKLRTRQEGATLRPGSHFTRKHLARTAH